MRTRSSTRDLEAAATAALGEAFSAIGLEIPAPSEGGRSDLVVRSPDGIVRTIEIRAAAVPTADWVANLRPSADRQMVVVADQIPTGIREHLNERGVAWLDRRGHLRLVGGGFFVDADVPSDQRSSTMSRPAISGRSGLAAAMALLLHPNEPVGVSEVARSAGMNASSISRATAALGEAQLAERLSRGRYRPLTPELFWALADVWPGTRPSVRVSIADLSDPRLGAYIDDLDAVGWAIGGERGATAWGAPLVLTGDYPTLLYVPDSESIRRAQVIGGEPEVTPDLDPPSVELAVDPTGLLTHTRYPAKRAGAPLAHPVACALDLAATSRGREALDQWDPPKGFDRVW